MKIITIKDLKEYIEYAKHQPLPENYSPFKTEDTEELIEIFQEMIDYFMVKLLLTNPHIEMLSLLMTGFQMGRHFEQRQIELKEMESFK